MTVPPYIAGAVGVWIMAWSSDRFNERAFHLLGSQLITILGLILTIVIPLGNLGGRYAGLVILTLGAYLHAPRKSKALCPTQQRPVANADLSGRGLACQQHAWNR